MTHEIASIERIKNLAVYKDFEWNLRDEGNNFIEFKKINIIYGRNYSGKTTLSRLIRALETKSISDKYNSPSFSIKLRDAKKITNENFASTSLTVRVFNEDFIKDNLKFMFDEQSSIAPFAIIGENNNAIESLIDEAEKLLGTQSEKTGLWGDFITASKVFDDHEKTLSELQTSLEEKLRGKANSTSTGIKHNKIFGDANYNVTKIKSDIAAVMQTSYKPFNGSNESDLIGLLKEEAKELIPEQRKFNYQYTQIIANAKELVSKKIQVSNPIQDLLTNDLLASWVRQGRCLHEGKRDTCGFCGGVVSPELWNKLDQHFNRESENLIGEVDALISTIDAEISAVDSKFRISRLGFYSQFDAQLNLLDEEISSTKDKYKTALNFVVSQLNNRKKEIFESFELEEPLFSKSLIDDIYKSFDKLRQDSNNFTSSLKDRQLSARKELRLHEVFKFATDIEYQKCLDDIGTQKQIKDTSEEHLKFTRDKLKEKQDEIQKLRAQLRDETKGAEKVNSYLNNFFGHQTLKLTASTVPQENGVVRYKFDVTRNGLRAYNLSEGECSLIAFCYFMAKLDDVETTGKSPIIWIDDPISSLDTNHIFFIYSLINAKITTPIRENTSGGTTIERERFSQLFISTHNLDFLKYLKRLPGALNKKTSQYFTIIRTQERSTIQLMPRYLRDYVTEFNYLFHQIYKCARADLQENNEMHDVYYNFGNNTRKFMEAYLYYKFPNSKDDKLRRFLGDDELSSALVDRINNEFSHLEGLFERSMSPIDIPEMKAAAQFILKKIEERDKDQYDALVESIS